MYQSYISTSSHFTTTSTKLSNEMQDQYVTIQTNDDASPRNYVTDLRNINIADSLNIIVNTNSSKNDYVFIKLLQDVKNNYLHVPLLNIKVNKHKHKKMDYNQDYKQTL